MTYLLDTSLRQFVLDILDSLVPRNVANDVRKNNGDPHYYKLVSESSTVDHVEQRKHPFLAVAGVFLILVVLLYAVAR